MTRPMERRWGEIALTFVEVQIRSGLSVPVELGGGPIGPLDVCGRPAGLGPGFGGRSSPRAVSGPCDFIRSEDLSPLEVCYTFPAVDRRVQIVSRGWSIENTARLPTRRVNAPSHQDFRKPSMVTSTIANTK